MFLCGLFKVETLPKKKWRSDFYMTWTWTAATRLQCYIKMLQPSERVLAGYIARWMNYIQSPARQYKMCLTLVVTLLGVQKSLVCGVNEGCEVEVIEDAQKLRRSVVCGSRLVVSDICFFFFFFPQPQMNIYHQGENLWLCFQMK